MKANTTKTAVDRLQMAAVPSFVKMGGGGQLGKSFPVPSFSLGTVLVCRLLLAVLLFYGLMCGSVSAQISHEEPDPSGNGNYLVINGSGETVFELRFFDSNDDHFYQNVSSARDLSDAEKVAIAQAAVYWADVLKPYGQMPVAQNPDGTERNAHQPVVINIGTTSGGTESYPLKPVESEINDSFLVQMSTALLADGTYVRPDTIEGHGSHGVMVIGTDSVNAPLERTASQVGRRKANLTTVAIHEFGHILGISSPNMEIDRYTGVHLSNGDYTAIYRFPQELTRWQALLRDNNGNTSVPKAYPDAEGKTVKNDPTNGGMYRFDTGDPNSPTQPARFTFVGRNALEVYYDGNEQLIHDGAGVPLQGLALNFYSYADDPNFINVEDPENPDATFDRWIFDPGGTLLHIDARNSAMSWQMYRNYPMFIEVELGALQDLGYDIERRNFFGRSFYVDGTTAINETPFWAWESLAGYLIGTPNTSLYGVGLHLFANDLNITQWGTIRADGPGAAGIRIDGVNNTLTIDQGVQVTAFGTNGIALLASYGKDHHIIHRGVLTTWDTTQDEATNQAKRTVQFNFGEPYYGPLLGSYAYDPNYGYLDKGNVPSGGYPEDLQGPLVKAFDVTGTIIGGTAGFGTPVIIPGRDDKIIARDGDSAHERKDDFSNVVRVFENGFLKVPDLVYGDDQVDRNRSTILVNKEDGCIVLLEGTLALADWLYYRVLSKVGYAEPPDYAILYDYPTLPLPYDSVVTHGEDANYIVIHPDGSINAPGYAIFDYLADRQFDDFLSRVYFTLDPRTYEPPDDITVVFGNGDGGNVEIRHGYVGDPYTIDYYGTDYQGTYIGDHAYVRDKNHNYIGTTYEEDREHIWTDYVSKGEVLKDPLWLAYVTPDQDTFIFMPGGGAAIYIEGYRFDDGVPKGGGAHVENINIMQGASIKGDIISHWNSRNDRADAAFSSILYDKGTTLTFGLKADANGAATAAPDPDFKFTFKDNINYYETVTRAYVNGRPGEEDILRWGYFNYDPEAASLKSVQLSGFPTDPGDTSVPPKPTDYQEPSASYLGLDDYDNSLYKIGNYVYAGPGEGRFNITDSWEVAGKIDLRFVGGHTIFQPNDENPLKISRSFVNSVIIDSGATFSLEADYRGTRKVTTSLLVMSDEHLGDSGIFLNNGRFSGEGTVMVGAQKGQDRYVIAELKNGVIAYLPPDVAPSGDVTIIPMAYYSANGTLFNRGTIAPGPNNGYGIPDEYVGTQLVVGKKTGVLAIGGNLDMGSSNSVYEVNITANRTTTEYYWDETNDGIELREREIIAGGWAAGESDRLIVSGKTTLGGTLVITPSEDSSGGYSEYSIEPTTYTIIRSEGGYEEGTNFENIECYTGFLEFVNVTTTYFDINEGKDLQNEGKDLQLTVIRDADYFKKHAGTYNEISVAKGMESTSNFAHQVAFSLADNRFDSADIRDMYNQLGAHIRANSALMNLWSPSEVLFRRIGYGNGQMDTGDRGRVNWQRILGKTSKMLGQEPTRRSRSGSLWADMLYTSFNATSDYDCNSSDYRFSRSGMMIGVEMNLTPYSAIGGVMAYNLGNTRQKSDKVDSNDYILGAYFVCAPFNEFEFKAYLGLGFQDYKMERNIYNAAIMDSSLENNPHLLHTNGPLRYRSDFVGNSLNMSLELARPLMLHPTFILRPTLAVDSQYLWQGGSTESATQGTGIYALSFKKMDYHRALFRAGFSSETTGPRGGIRMRAFYVAQFDGNNFPDSNAAFATGGATFNVRGVDLGGEFLNLGVGSHVWLDGEKTASLFFDYDSEIYGTHKKTLSHTVQFGYLQTF